MPDAFNFQAVLRQDDGTPMANEELILRFSISNDLEVNEIVYEELHSVFTSPLGVANLRIGRGAANLGTFSALDWASPKYLTMALRRSTEEVFLVFSTTELVAVPYALYAKEVADEGRLYRSNDTIFHQNTTGAIDTISLPINAELPDCRDDFLIYQHQEEVYSLLRNDRASDSLVVVEIAGQSVVSNSILALPTANFITLRVSDDAQSIEIDTDIPLDTILQFDYRACDLLGNCGEARVTLVVNTLNEPIEEPLSGQDLGQLLFAAQAGDTIDGQGARVVIQGKPLSISRPVVLKNFHLTRAAPTVSHLAVASSVNTTEIILESTVGFQERDWILIVNGPEYLNNSGGQIHAIREIVGDTIRVFQEFPFAMPVGAIVVHHFPMVKVQSSAGEGVYIEHSVFDGNKAENDYTFDWRYNSTINAPTGTVITNCIFKNTPSENIFLCGGELRNNSSYALNGSFVHISCGSTNESTSIIENNYSFQTCMIPEVVNGHNEGWFTYSANTRNCIVRGNTARYGGEACFGNQGPDDFGNLFINNYFESFAQRKFGTSAGHPQPDDLSSNTFVNVPE